MTFVAKSGDGACGVDKQEVEVGVGFGIRLVDEAITDLHEVGSDLLTAYQAETDPSVRSSGRAPSADASASHTPSSRG